MFPELNCRNKEVPIEHTDEVREVRIKTVVIPGPSPLPGDPGGVIAGLSRGGSEDQQIL